MGSSGEVSNMLNNDVDIRITYTADGFNITITCDKNQHEIYNNFFKQNVLDETGFAKNYKNLFDSIKKERLNSMVFLHFFEDCTDYDNLDYDVIRICIPNNDGRQCCFTFTKEVYDNLIRDQLNKYADDILCMFDTENINKNNWTFINYKLKHNFNICNCSDKYKKYLMKKVFMFMGLLTINKNVKMCYSYMSNESESNNESESESNNERNNPLATTN